MPRPGDGVPRARLQRFARSRVSLSEGVASFQERTGTIPIDLETVTEARLVAQALAGSQSAFEQIVRRFQLA